MGFWSDLTNEIINMGYSDKKRDEAEDRRSQRELYLLKHPESRTCDDVKQGQCITRIWQGERGKGGTIEKVLTRVY